MRQSTFISAGPRLLWSRRLKRFTQMRLWCKSHVTPSTSLCSILPRYPLFVTPTPLTTLCSSLCSPSIKIRTSSVNMSHSRIFSSSTTTTLQLSVCPQTQWIWTRRTGRICGNPSKDSREFIDVTHADGLQIWANGTSHVCRRHTKISVHGWTTTWSLCGQLSLVKTVSPSSPPSLLRNDSPKDTGFLLAHPSTPDLRMLHPSKITSDTSSVTFQPRILLITPLEMFGITPYRLKISRMHLILPNSPNCRNKRQVS
jgi:hypothetical protein